MHLPHRVHPQQLTEQNRLRPADADSRELNACSAARHFGKAIARIVQAVLVD